jgi:hypothetical protein
MKIIKIGLPLVVVVAALALSADQGLRRQEVLTADAGALPEATVIANKLYGPRLAQNAPVKSASKAAAKPRLAEASILGR